MPSTIPVAKLKFYPARSHHEFIRFEKDVSGGCFGAAYRGYRNLISQPTYRAIAAEAAFGINHNTQNAGKAIQVGEQDNLAVSQQA